MFWITDQITGYFLLPVQIFHPAIKLWKQILFICQNQVNISIRYQEKPWFLIGLKWFWEKYVFLWTKETMDVLLAGNCTFATLKGNNKFQWFTFNIWLTWYNLFGTMRYVQTFHNFILDVKVLEGIVAFVMKKGSQYSQLFNYM